MKIVVIGGGTMGNGIAHTAGGQRVFDVALVDVNAAHPRAGDVDDYRQPPARR